MLNMDFTQPVVIDEHGRYPAGTWIRRTHMSLHEPWVERETVLWVKTGHLA